MQVVNGARLELHNWVRTLVVVASFIATMVTIIVTLNSRIVKLETQMQYVASGQIVAEIQKDIEFIKLRQVEILMILSDSAEKGK